MSFSERLRQVRTQKGFSQSELARLVGVHYTQIGRYEKKGAQPSAEVLNKIANALSVSTDFLISGSTDEQAENKLEDRELLSQFRKIEKFPSDKKEIIKELLDAFIVKTELQNKFAS